MNKFALTIIVIVAGMVPAIHPSRGQERASVGSGPGSAASPGKLAPGTPVPVPSATPAPTASPTPSVVPTPLVTPTAPLAPGPILISPADGSTIDSLRPTLVWNAGNIPDAWYGHLRMDSEHWYGVFYSDWTSGTCLMDQWWDWNLDPSTTYYWKTQVIFSGGSSAWSEQWRFTTPDSGYIPPAPALIEPANGSIVENEPDPLWPGVTCRWSEVSGAAEMVLLYGTNPGYWEGISPLDCDLQCTSDVIPVSYLEDGQTYYWWVVAASDYAAGPESEAWRFTYRYVPTPTPAPPSAVAVWGEDSGKWMVDYGPLQSPDVFYFGRAGDLPTSGDFDGDGTVEAAVFRPKTGLWAVRGLTRAFLGKAGDSPVPADYAGDGTAAPAVFRPSSGLWAVRGLTRVFFGRPGDLPVPGDYGGDGTVRPAIFRPAGGLWAVRGLTRFYHGRTGDLPVPADYAGDGPAAPAIFRPSSGLWAVRGMTRFHFGLPDDHPQPGDYAGNGTAGAAVYRRDEGLWFLRGLTRTFWGGEEYVPVAW